ncbi:MAG: amidohydrolase [Gammaproteobacteria bacterium]|nr:amidohydrolase [Gammaproteobacteria bacterium]
MSISAAALRRSIHAHPDMSGDEKATADRLRDYFAGLGHNNIIDAIGGTGLAVVIAGQATGPTIMLRAELDALPIEEPNSFSHRSTRPGISHKCGHDGHMAILAEVGRRLTGMPLSSGRVVLLFQPAEETGKGALDILNDPLFGQIKPDQVYALHNLPGVALGDVVCRPGTFSCASRGVHIHLRGLETHAAQPEHGTSPSRAIRRLLQMIESSNEHHATDGGLDFATVTHLKMGSESFGIAPGSAHMMLTLRSEHDAKMAEMLDELADQLKQICGQEKIDCAITFDDVFPATINDSGAFERIRAAIPANRLTNAKRPFRWSEDFGHFTSRFPGAMFGIGAGAEIPALHHPEYDFPDGLIDPAADIFMQIVMATSGR